MALDFTRRGICAVGLATMALPGMAAYGRGRAPMGGCERWGIKEIALKGPSAGNPFLDVTVSGVFDNGQTSISVPGFYDGDGTYCIRFCPPAAGPWKYVTKSNATALDGKSGHFVVAAPSKDNHGPVRVANTFHFAYADGAPYWQIGTTCYAWSLQSDALCEQTLKTLAASPFNKIRMALFPNSSEPSEPFFPFAGKPKAWDFSRFDPVYYRRLEKRLAQLADLGIEADIILFHPYDGDVWDFDKMPAEADDRYLRYTVARLAAFRNVWWSMANEYDLMKHKSESDFDRFFQIVRDADPYGRLRSIHNCFAIYNNAQPWVTHASIQGGNFVEDAERAMILRDVWRKPVIYDEVKYEGNHVKRWAQLSGEELVDRFWNGTVGGTYVGHSELFDDKDYSDKALCWLGTGGVLKGASPLRLKFLRRILQEAPAQGLEPIDKWQDRSMAGVPGEYYLHYFGQQTPKSWTFLLPRDHDNVLQEGMRFTVDILDTWAMTATPADGVFTVKKQGQYDFADAEGRSVILPGKPGTALRIRKVA